ncbi:hypothetical protein Tco_1042438 [Tanacetum coccineum]|uniref:Uncharacterized protein n=1 Tax=Tanacetum coccineum TaxID=301880 RepID=A0ABQ5GLQ6_9ASTR
MLNLIPSFEDTYCFISSSVLDLIDHSTKSQRLDGACAYADALQRVEGLMLEFVVENDCIEMRIDTRDGFERPGSRRGSELRAVLRILAIQVHRIRLLLRAVQTVSSKGPRGFVCGLLSSGRVYGFCTERIAEVEKDGNGKMEDAKQEEMERDGNHGREMENGGEGNGIRNGNNGHEQCGRFQNAMWLEE